MSAPSFIEIVRASKPAMSPGDQDAVIELVDLAIARYSDGWRQYFVEEEGRLARVIDHIDRALAAVLAASWEFHEDDDWWFFRDEAGAYAWLKREGPNPEASEPGEELMARSNDWQIRSLWSVRQEFDEQWGDLLAWDKARWKQHWTRPPDTTSRLPVALQEMIHDCCQVWHDFVDPSLGLPRRDASPTNPLLRYLDACLQVPLGDQRPHPKTVLQLVFDYIRPSIREDDRAAEAQRQIEAARPRRVDLDAEVPF